MAASDRFVSVQQTKAWAYYGFPGLARASRDGKGISPIGEVRYVVGWAADQMSRMRWGVLIDGSTDWTITLPDGSTVRSKPDENDADAAESHASASAQVMDLVGWTPTTVRQITTNLYVAGELGYSAVPDPKNQEKDTWQVVSVVRPDRDDITKAATHTIRGLWPHPADPETPDAPLFGVLPLLEELDWLSKLARSQSASRIGMRGVIGAADGLSVANGGEFWTEFERSIQTRMEDPTNVSPLMVRGAAELVEPAGSGMKGLSWVVPDFPFDDRVGEQTQSVIQRIAYGLPIPPEILLGLQASSRAVAYQMEENSYRAHIEPSAQLVARIGEDAIRLLLPGRDIEVVPDPTDLLARRHSVQDVKDAYDRGLVSGAYVREVLDIPETAAATAADLALLEQVNSKTVAAAATDPATVAAQEPVTAAVGGPDDARLTADELDKLGIELAHIDHSLMMELAGATVQAVDRARDKVGARARTFEVLRKNTALSRDVPNSLVVATVGMQTMTDLGIPVADIVAESLVSLGQWWQTRASKAQMTVTALLGVDAAPAFTDTDVRLSADLLVDVTASHVLATIESVEASPVPSDARVSVLTALGGG